MYFNKAVIKTFYISLISRTAFSAFYNFSLIPLWKKTHTAACPLDLLYREHHSALGRLFRVTFLITVSLCLSHTYKCLCLLDLLHIIF